jgi:hypothetical protein
MISAKCVQCLINAAGSTGRCNTIQCSDSAMLLRENHLFGCTRPEPSQATVPAIETTIVIGKVESRWLPRVRFKKVKVDRRLQGTSLLFNGHPF